MPTYATVADFESYVEGWVTDDAAALDRLLERAERDLDALFAPYVRDPATGRKIIPANLLDDEARDALARATCAQAEHRFRHPAAFTGEARASRVKGPDFEEDYTGAGAELPGRYSPNLRVELEPISYLMLGTARARP